MKKKNLKEVLIISFISIGLVLTNGVYASPNEVKASLLESEFNVTTSRENLYREYLISNEKTPLATENINVNIDEFVEIKDAGLVDTFEDSKSQVLISQEMGFVEYLVDVAEDSMFEIQVTYFPVEGKSVPIQCELRINDEIPFYESKTILLDRIWRDSGEIQVDGNGNEIRPSQEEFPIWVTTKLSDTSSTNLPLRFFFKKGQNKIRISNTREILAFKSLKLIAVAEPLNYYEVYNSYPKSDLKVMEFNLKIEGENSYLKSDPMLYPIFDRSSPLTSPPITGKLKLNTIGGYRWRLPGQWIEWRFDVPENGLYKISLRSRQGASSGSYSERILYVNGEIPFKEAENIRFDYSTRWKLESLGNKDGEFLFYLQKGENKIRLQNTTGTMTEKIQVIEESLLILNSCYRSIIMLTGPVPDPFRDYEFKKEIPEVIQELGKQSEIIKKISEEISADIGEKNSHLAILDRLAVQLDDIYNNPNTLAERLNSFKDNVAALGSWVLFSRELPLEIDYILVSDPSFELPDGEVGFFRRLLHEIKSFVNSFIIDYSSMGSSNKDLDREITVWTTHSREQTQTLRQLIDQRFDNQEFGVNLEVVDAGTLLPSVLAGINPDISLNIPSANVMNFAARGALKNIDDFHGADDIFSRFYESSIIPLQFDNKTYGIPETQSFPVMFYRKDIFEELELEVPQTWDEVYNLLPDLQKRNMEFAFPLGLPVYGIPLSAGMPTFGIFLYQMGGEFYKDDGRKSNLDSEVSIAAFKKWTELYTNYKMPIQFDFANRFRTGEMPIGIADYSIYNLLGVFAPEIKGMWEISPIPKYIDSEGNENRYAPGNTTSAVILEKSKRYDESWIFLKWWTDKNTQIAYGREIESVMGSAARYPSANFEAVKGLPWTSAELDVLMEQWGSVKGIPEYPGGYYTPRYLDFAFRKVVLAGENPRETILDYTQVINDEITYKRQEIGLKD